jgi:Suppressor of fused protein (SUFU)
MAQSEERSVNSPRASAAKFQPLSRHDLRLGRATVEGTHLYDAGRAWHYVTLGLTELYDQSDASVGPNGIRCELSMRIAKRESVEPPLWPVAFLGKIASHISQGAVLAQGVSFRTGPIARAPRGGARRRGGAPRSADRTPAGTLW